LHVIHWEVPVKRTLAVHPRFLALVDQQSFRARDGVSTGGVGLLLETDGVAGIAQHAFVPAQRRGAADHAPADEADAERHAAVTENIGIALAAAVDRVTNRRHRRV